MVKVVAELARFVLFAVGDLGGDDGVLPQPGAQSGQQVGVLGETFHQDLLGTVQRFLGGVDAVFGIQVAGRQFFRILRRVGKDGVGEWFEAGLAGDHGTGATLRFVRQVQIFQPGLAVGFEDLGLECRGQFVLLADAFQNRGTAILQLAQVAQALIQITQLGVVQPAGGFFPVAGDKRHGGAFIQQGDGGTHLLGLTIDLAGDDRFDAGLGGGRGRGRHGDKIPQAKNTTAGIIGNEAGRSQIVFLC